MEINQKFKTKKGKNVPKEPKRKVHFFNKLFLRLFL